MEIEQKLRALGYELPEPSRAYGSYVGTVQVGNLLFVSGNTGRIGGQLKYVGKVGDAVTPEQAYEMARNCALNHLAAIKAALGDLDRVERVVKVPVFVNAAPSFTDVGSAANGESDLLVQLWGDGGQHTRSTIGVALLAGNAPVEIEIIVQVKDSPRAHSVGATHASPVSRRARALPEAIAAPRR